MSAAQIPLSFDPYDYPAGFWQWIEQPDNKRIYARFSRMALRMASLGRARYSARTIVEAMRWSSDLRDTDRQFKINDHYTPGMARLWMFQHGDKYPKFFELRSSPG